MVYRRPWQEQGRLERENEAAAEKTGGGIALGFLGGALVAFIEAGRLQLVLGLHCHDGDRAVREEERGTATRWKEDDGQPCDEDQRLCLPPRTVSQRWAGAREGHAQLGWAALPLFQRDNTVVFPFNKTVTLLEFCGKIGKE